MNFEYENTLHWLTPTGRLLLHLTKHSDGQMILYLYYKENG